MPSQQVLADKAGICDGCFYSYCEWYEYPCNICSRRQMEDKYMAREYGERIWSSKHKEE